MSIKKSQNKNVQIINIMQPSQQQHYFLLFINSKSGGQKGQQFLSLTKNQLKFKIQNQMHVYIYIYDLYQKEQKIQGLKNVLKLTNQKNNVNVIVCGGDGTVLWVVNEVLQIGVNYEKVCFGVIPIGTGNDFSRSLGWGGTPISFQRSDLHELVHLTLKWLKASKQNFDLWDTDISTYNNGNISISSTNIQQQQSKITEFSRTFCNYLGIGIDARVSYHFQKNRTKSKLINFFIYGCLGLRYCFKKSDKINQAVSQFQENQLQSQEEVPADKQKILEDDKQDSKQTKNKMRLLQKYTASEDRQIKLKKGYTGLVCLNCTSYMSGVKNVFNTNKIAAKNKKNTDFTDSKFNDDKIQFVGFKNQLSLGLQRFVNTAGKVAQGHGPFSIKFHQLPEMRETFIQIDGEAMLVKGLKQIKIAKSTLTPTGKIKVLVKK